MDKTQRLIDGMRLSAGPDVIGPAAPMPTAEEALPVARARIRELEADLAACKIARDGFTAASDTAHARVIELEVEHAKAELRIKAIIEWLEKNQPNVFSRGIWDAVAASQSDREA